MQLSTHVCLQTLNQMLSLAEVSDPGRVVVVDSVYTDTSVLQPVCRSDPSALYLQSSDIQLSLQLQHHLPADGLPAAVHRLPGAVKLHHKAPDAPKVHL